MDTSRTIEEILKGKTWLSRGNSNTQISPSLVDYVIFSKAVEDYALKRLYSPAVARAHNEGSMYIHTLHSALRPYCLPEDAVIIFKDSNGVKIDTIKTMANVLENSITEIYTPFGFKRLKAVLSKSVDEVENFIKITTNDGVIWLTNEHRVPTKEGIKKADEIKEGDILLKLRNLSFINGEKSSINLERMIRDVNITEVGKIFLKGDFLYTKGCWKLRRDIKITQNLMSFIGLYLAEGHHRFQVGKNNDIIITCSDDEIIKWLDDFSRDNEFKHSTQSPSRRGKQTYIESGLWFLIKYGFGIEDFGASEKRIPDIIFNTLPEMQNAFLKGMFSGDGGLITNFEHSQIIISYTTTSKVMAQQLYFLLLSKGFSPRIRIEKPFTGVGNVANKNGMVIGRKELYRILLSGYANAEYFYNTIGFIDKKRMRTLKQYLEKFHRDSRTQWINIERMLLNSQTNKKTIALQTGRTLRAVECQLYNQLSQDREIIVKNVEVVEKYGNSVYDLEIEEPHIFYTGFGGVAVHNCNGVDPRVFLLDGLRFPHCRSAPAKHFSSAVYQSMAYMFYSQLFFAGAQAMDYYNWFLAPYAHYDRLSYAEIKQAVQGIVYQLNQSNRTGAQSAFTNIGLRINCPSYLKEQGGQAVPVIYRGEKLNVASYADFEYEARLIYKAFMEVMREGDGNGLPFTFPLITTAITKDLDWNDPLVVETMKTAAEKGTPYFFNLTADYLDEKYVHAMCCRLLVQHSGGVWQAGGIGTGSNKVVTLNLPHIALLARNDEGRFFEILDEKLEAARRALKESNEIIRRSLNEWKLLPLLEMKTVDGAPYYSFKDRKLTIGMIGMNECLLNLIGRGLASEDGLKLGKKIVARMAKKAEEFSRKDGVMYTLEQTPAEAAGHKLATADRKRFGRKAHVQGSAGKLYYTNSTHVPYNEDVDLFEKVKAEAEFHPFFNGGTICHVWVGESRPDPGAMKSLVRKMAGTKLAYFTFSPDFSVCRKNHVERGKVERCPVCRGKMDHMNRIVGYFTRTSRWNPGKQQEYADRKRYRL